MCIIFILPYFKSSIKRTKQKKCIILSSSLDNPLALSWLFEHAKNSLSLIPLLQYSNDHVFQQNVDSTGF